MARRPRLPVTWRCMCCSAALNGPLQLIMGLLREDAPRPGAVGGNKPMINTGG